MMMYLGLSIFVNIILIVYLIYIYLIKGELRENKNVEYNNVEYNETDPPDDPAQCLSEIDKLNAEITTLKFTHQDLNEKATIIRHGMDRLMQAATRSNITIN
jgi:hypothetical protein